MARSDAKISRLAYEILSHQFRCMLIIFRLKICGNIHASQDRAIKKITQGRVQYVDPLLIINLKSKERDKIPYLLRSGILENA